MWAYPREQSAKEKMRQCYEDIVNNNTDTYASRACDYSLTLKERFSEEKMFSNFIEIISEDVSGAVSDDEVSELFESMNL